MLYGNAESKNTHATFSRATASQHLYTVIKQNGCRIKFNLVVDLSALTNVAWNSKFAMFMGRTNTQKFDVSMSIITM